MTIVRMALIIGLCLLASSSDAGFAIFQVAGAVGCGGAGLLVTAPSDCSNILETAIGDRLLAN